MFASPKIHAQILGRRAALAPSLGLAAGMVSALLAASLAGCGQKGPLFLPPPPPVLVSSPPTAQPRPAASAPLAPVPAASAARPVTP